MDSRQNLLSQWCAEQLSLPHANLTMVSGDASFRRYFRLALDNTCYIAMDAPPEKEDSESFVRIARDWHRQGIRVPELIAVDLTKGFLLLEDFGDQVLLTSLDPDKPEVSAGDRYYNQAISYLLDIQQSDHSELQLPPYDSALLLREMELFPDWLLTQKLGLDLNNEEQALLEQTFVLLIENALAQPAVTVHRDYHARNLMICEDEGLGVLDFQDAVLGPITYDLVSLLRDCYIVWPDAELERWRALYFQQALDRKLLDADYSEFCRWFDLMGLQRHLKAAGIFARLSLRDGKHAYLQDIPRTLNYLIKHAARHEDTRELSHWLQRTVQPALISTLSQQ